MPVLKRIASMCSVVVLALSVGSMSGARADTLGPNRYQEMDLVSDVPGAAAHLDPNLVNAW